MEFEVFTTNVDLQDIPSYTTNITLEGQLLKLSFLWNERIGKRTLFIRNSADICYLQNTILHPNESFELNSNAVFDDLPYKVVLQKVGDTNKVGNIYNWSKDFTLCFYRTIDIETEKLNVKYGVTAPSTPTLPKPFGNWILNQDYELVNEDIKYSAYKTNSLDYYDSFANLDLTTAIVRSLHDEGMQQLQAVIAACNELTGVTAWEFDIENSQVTYGYSVGDVVWSPNYNPALVFPNGKEICEYHISYVNGHTITNGGDPSGINSDGFYECWYYNSAWVIGTQTFRPTAVTTEQKYTIPFNTIAQKIISNAESGTDEVLKLLSEDYIKLVAESIFNTDTSKQFVKLEDLIHQLEANKVLR